MKTTFLATCVAITAACGAGTGGASAAKDKTHDISGTDAMTAAAPSGTVRNAPHGPTVLFIGTSLTAGLGLSPDQAYPQMIERMADSAGVPIRAINAGVSGETSAGALARIDWVLKTPADAVVIETGANDALRALPVAAARANISRILDRVKAAKPRARVFLVQMEAPPNLGSAYTTAFHDMYGELARQKGATLLPFLLGRVAGRSGLNQADGVHPNLAGERLVAEDVWAALKPGLAGLTPSAGR